MKQLQCPQCGNSLDIPDELSGGAVKCGGCRHEFVAEIPSEATSAPAKPASRVGETAIRTIAVCAFLTFLMVLLGVFGEIMDESAAKARLKEERTAQEFEARRKEAWDAFGRGKINLAEREGLLARIRDEEEKLK